MKLAFRKGRGAVYEVLTVLAFALACGLAFPVQMTLGEENPNRYEASEEQIKAAFVYNFLKFVEWPRENVRTPIVLCAVASSTMADTLQALNGKTIRNRPLKVIVHTRIPRSFSCDALFISSGVGTRFARVIFSHVQSRPVLTISDRQGFVREGGIIELFREKNRIRFKINLRAATAVHLKISSKLLKLAREVNS